MKKFWKNILIISVLLFLFSFNFHFVYGTSEVSNLSSSSVFLMDNRTNKVLYSKNENEKMYPASTTKILTAILTLENSNLDDIVTASYDSVMSIPDGYSTANIQIGEQLTVEQLLQMLLVHSANDAANILAEHVGGSIDSFVSMMNTKLNELGLYDSHFTNTYGKHDENHYTTAHDLAYLFKYCLNNETFRKIAGSASCAIPTTNESESRLYTSTNELLNPNSQNYYKYLTAGKTGYTTQAKECLVSSAYKDNLELISVVLGSTNRFYDTKNLFEYGFSNYEVKNIVSANDVVSQIEVSNGTKDTRHLDLLVKETIPALVKSSETNLELNPNIHLNDNISAPISENQTLGTVTYEINGVEYTTDLISSHAVEKSKMLEYILYIGILLVVLILFYEFSSLKKNNRKKFKRYKR